VTTSLNPDKLLADAREALRDWLAASNHTVAERDAAARLAFCFGDLDRLLCTGVLLPADWVPFADRDPEPVQDVPLPGEASPVLPYPPASVGP
jgi:hypothetical protein